MNRTRLSKSIVALILMLAMILVACGPQQPATTESPTSAPGTEPTENGTDEELEEPDDSPSTEEGPAVGGRFVYAATQQPDTLDIQKSGFGITNNVSTWIGGSLVAKNIEGQYIPYLAESWTISDDGLEWTLQLRDDVLFHNGDPLRAQDWVYTIERAKDPDTGSPVTGGLVAPVTEVSAPDDYTLVLRLDEPFFPLLENLSSGYLQPYSQRAVEEAGDDIGRNPVSVGPYKFKEWRQDEYIILERNPDYTWGPEYYEGANTGPYYFEEVEYRVIPEYAAQLAALQSGAIDMMYPQAKDVETLLGQGNITAEQFVSTATFHMIVNTEVEPFDDLNVRKAFTMALDRQAIINVATNGTATEVHGPLTPSVVGYDPAVEDAGYGFDLEQARALMEEAGYTYNDEGMLELDGEPLAITLKTPNIDYYVRISQIAVEQWRDLGAEVAIEQHDWGALSPQYAAGDFQIGTLEVGWPEADILWLWFHSSQIDTYWGPRMNDPELDRLLDLTRTTTDPEERQEIVSQVQARIAENVLLMPILALSEYTAVNDRVVGEQFSPFFGTAGIFASAYIAEQ